MKANIYESKEEICQSIRCEYFLTKSKNGLYCCPFCGSGTGIHGTGALKLYSTNTFYCFKCGKRGDVIDLIQEHYNTDYKGALAIAINELNINIVPYDGKNIIFDGSKITSSNKSIEKNADCLTEEVDYTNFFLTANKDIEKTDYHRGLSLDTLNRFKIGFVEKWKHPKALHAPESPRLIIPTSKYSYLARDVRTDIPEAEKIYTKSKVGNLHFFNIEALDCVTKPIFIVEGELDALSIIDVGGEAISLGTITKIKSFLELIKIKNPKQPLIISLDNDNAGDKASQQLIEGLKEFNIPFCKVNLCGNFKDPNEAFINNKGKFAILVSKAENMYDEIEQKRLEKFSKHFAFERLQGFINGIVDSVNTLYIPTGFKSLDNILDGGLYEGLYIVGAISSLGKTTLALQICDQIAQSGWKILIFSLEMSMNELISKSISRHTLQISKNYENAKTARDITTGSKYKRYNSKELALIENSIKAYEKYAKNICVYEGIGDMGVCQIVEKIKDFISFTGEKPVVLIDYVQILAPSNIRATDKQNTDKAVIELKRMSRDFKIPVIGISSFNRSSYKGQVTMEAFKESGSLEYGSDVLIGLQFENAGKENFDVNEAKMKNPRKIELVMLKNRNGSVGNKLRFDYYPKFNLFKEVG